MPLHAVTRSKSYRASCQNKMTTQNLQCNASRSYKVHWNALPSADDKNNNIHPSLIFVGKSNPLARNPSSAKGFFSVWQFSWQFHTAQFFRRSTNSIHTNSLTHKMKKEEMEERRRRRHLRIHERKKFNQCKYQTAVNRMPN